MLNQRNVTLSAAQNHLLLSYALNISLSSARNPSTGTWYGLMMPLTDLYVEVILLDITAFRNRAFTKVVKVTKVIKMGS